MIPQLRGNSAVGTPITYTTTPTTLASKGGLLINIDSAVGDIATIGATFIEDEKHGFYFTNTANAVSAEFDTVETRTGNKTLKVSTTNISGRWRVLEYTPSGGKGMIPIKTSTKYKFGIWVKSTNCTQITWNLFSAPDQANYGTLTQRASLNLATGTTDWTYYTTTFTSHATDTIYAPQFRLETAGNISDAWFDINSMTLEEVVEPVANTLSATNKTPSIQSFTAVGSTDNIDQSLDPTFVAVNTYTPPVAISEGATEKQTFVPTKSKLTRIGVYPVAKGTGNWTVTVHDASNVVQASITIANASLTNGVVNYFNVPCNLTTLASYHFHVTSTVADGTVRVATASDLETCSYIQNYYKPTTSFTARQNNSLLEMRADEDGFLDGSVVNLVNGTYTYSDNYTNELKTIDSIFAVNTPYLFVDTANSRFFINESTSSPIRPNRQPIFKVDMGGVSSSMTVQATIIQSRIEYSYDNVTYFTGVSQPTSSEIVSSFTITPNQRIVYLKFVRQTTNDGVFCYFKTFSITATIDTSSLNTLYNYPTNKDVIEYYTKSLASPTTTAIYRATKYGFPGIEYSNGEFQFLNIDTTATGSTVSLSEDNVSYTLTADGGSIALSSTSTPIVFVKANITANRLYSSSNDYVASSDKDGSLQQSLTYQVVE